MEKIDYFFELISKSTISLLGYSFSHERLKDEIISKVPFLEIDSSFSLASLRDIKIDHVLCDINIPNISSKLLLLDLNKIASNGDYVYGGKQKMIRDVVRRLRYEIHGSGFKLLLLSPVYGNTSGSSSFLGGISPVHECDLCCVIRENKIKVLKNRFGSNDIEISLDGLKDYNYICNYENS